jgi:hypothetical protein
MGGEMFNVLAQQIIRHALGLGLILGGVEGLRFAYSTRLELLNSEVALVLCTALGIGLILGVLCGGLGALVGFLWRNIDYESDRIAIGTTAAGAFLLFWEIAPMAWEHVEQDRLILGVVYLLFMLLFTALIWYNALYWLRRAALGRGAKIGWHWISLLSASVMFLWSMLIYQGRSYGNDKVLQSDPDVVLISIDGLRADAIGPKTMPFLSRFSESAIVYSEAIATTPIVGMSHAEQLTGMHALHSGILSGELRYSSLATRLKKEGYARVAFLSDSTFGADSTLKDLQRDFELFDAEGSYSLRGFAELPFFRMLPWLGPRRISQRSSSEIVTRVLRFSELFSDKPTFFWVQLSELTQHFLEAEEYRAALLKLDGELEALITGLEERNRSSVVAIAGSYGMMLGEHERAGAAFGLYEELIRVPLMIKPLIYENLEAVTHSVRLLDLYNTLLRQLKLPHNGKRQSADLIRTLNRGFTGANALLVGEDLMLNERSWMLGYRGVSQGSGTIYKLSLNPARKKTMLVVPHVDRREREDISEEQQKIYMQMLSVLKKASTKLPEPLDLSWVPQYEIPPPSME